MNEKEIRELKELLIRMTEKWEQQLDGMIDKLDKLNEKLDRVSKKLGIDVNEEITPTTRGKQQPGNRVIQIDGNSHMISWETREIDSTDS